MMNEADTIKFIDVETSEESVVIIRYDESSVAICLSVKANSDLEVVMTKKDALALLEALRKAVK